MGNTTPLGEGDDFFSSRSPSRISLLPTTAVKDFGATSSPQRHDTAYKAYVGSTSSANFRSANLELGGIDPVDIEDDDDDPFSSLQGKQAKQTRRPHPAIAAGAGIGAGVAAAGSRAFMGGFAPRDTSGQYGSVPGGSDKEASDWLSKQKSGSKR